MSAIIPARMRSAGELALAVQGYAERGWPVLPLWWSPPSRRLRIRPLRPLQAGVAICWWEEAQIVTSEHERYSADQIVVRCTVRAAVGVPDEHGVVKLTGSPFPTAA